MDALRKAISKKHTLEACLLVTRQFAPNTKISDYLHSIDELANEATDLIDQQACGSVRLNQFIQMFYTSMAFSSNENEFFNSKYNLLDSVIDYRTGTSVMVAVIFCALAQRLGFEANGVNFPGYFLIRVGCKEQRAMFIDPLCGKTLNWQALEKLYFSIGCEADDEEMPANVLDEASTEEIVVRMLHDLKASLVREEQYQQALQAVDVIIALSPDDPYERRDRGFLLHQLECPQVAQADYQYFIEHCPQDPSAEILKLQMRQWESSAQVVLH